MIVCLFNILEFLLKLHKVENKLLNDRDTLLCKSIFSLQNYIDLFFKGQGTERSRISHIHSYLGFSLILGLYLK